MRANARFVPCVLLSVLLASGVLPNGGLFATNTTTEETAATHRIDPLSLPDDTPPPLNSYEIDSSYVGDSSFTQKRFDGAGTGRTVDYRGLEEVQNSIELTRRFHLFDRIYLKLGAKYDRFDFSETNAPVPTTLQSLHGIVGLEYIVKGEPAVTLSLNPGVFVSRFDDVSLGSVDVPIDLATGVPIPFLHNVFGIVGVHISILSKNVVYPIFGVAWIINDRLSLQAFPPEPRLVYKVTDHLDVFAGAELLGEAYKTSRRNNLRPQEARFNGAVLDYSETRIGGGLTYNVNKAVNFDFSGGCSISRDFDYYRPDASKRFITHPAPYAKIEFSAEF